MYEQKPDDTVRDWMETLERQGKAMEDWLIAIQGALGSVAPVASVHPAKWEEAREFLDAIETQMKRINTESARLQERAVELKRYLGGMVGQG